jgi:hypothetical protein
MSQSTDQARGRSNGASLGKGSRTTPAPVRPHVPSPPRRRRPLLTALAVLLIVGGAALAGLLALRMDSREPVVVVGQRIDVGEKVTASMLRTTNVSGAVDAIPLDDVDQIVGRYYARQTIYPGQLLQLDLLRKDPPLEVDQAQVGVPLTSGKFPPGLRSGDAVRLTQIGDGQNPSVALCTGLVLEVSTSSSGGGFGSGARSAVATVLIPQSVSDQVVGATGTDKLGITLVGRGIGIDDAQIQALVQGKS